MNYGTMEHFGYLNDQISISKFHQEFHRFFYPKTLKTFFENTAKPLGSACIGDHQNVTNVSRIIATF